MSLPDSPIYLWPEKPLVEPDREHIKDQRLYAVDNPSMTPFWPDPTCATGASAVIFPGGGYVRLSMDNEGYALARWLNACGIAAFVVKYRLKEYGFPAPLLDGLRAMRVLRNNAKGWGLATDKIGAIGFSAGGHIAAGIATQFEVVIDKDDPMVAVSARPDFVVLGYPVITLEGEGAHAGSRTALLGEDPDPALVFKNSLQHHVNAQVPPMFIFHGIADQSVPVANSLMFFNAVQAFNRQSELHIYQSSIHGVGMVQRQGTISSWTQALEAWLKYNAWMK